MKKLHLKNALIALIIVCSQSSLLGQALVWNQDFNSDAAGWLDVNDGWYGAITFVGDGTALVEGDPSSAPFSRFDGYRDTWEGDWKAEIDVYLDPSAWSDGEGFDYSVAANGSDGSHQRDYIFHVTQDTSSEQLIVAGSNNTNFAPREDLDTLVNHYAVTTAGWYTLQHYFRDAGGSLAVDLNLLDSDGNVLFTETRFTVADTIPTEVGGNRYAWFTVVDVDGGISVDNHQLFSGPILVIDGCDTGLPDRIVDGSMRISDFIQQCVDAAKNHGQFVKCVAALTNELVAAGIISNQDKGAIMSCAGQADLP